MRMILQAIDRLRLGIGRGVGLLLLCAVMTRAGEGTPDLLRGDAYEYAPHRAGSEVDASWKINVASDGLHRVTGAALRRVGFGSVQGSRVRLFCRDREVAVYVSTAGVLRDSDYLLFYGTRHEGTYTQTNAYWLGVGEGGLRWTERDGAPVPGWPTVLDGRRSYIFEEESLFRPFYRPLDGAINHWFSALLMDDAWVTVADQHDSFVNPAGTAKFSAVFYGLSSVAGVSPDHRSELQFNESVRAGVTYDGAVRAELTNATVGAEQLVNRQWIEAKQERLPGVPDPGDRAYLKRLEFSYPAWLHSNEAELDFQGTTGNKNYEAVFYTHQGAKWILNVEDPWHPEWIRDAATRVDTRQHLTFSAALATNDRIRIFDASQVRDAAPEFVRFRDLAATDRAADYLVICPYAFRDEVYRLLTQRHLQGLRVAVAPISDVYNEFSYGIKEAEAIRQFIGYAYHHWAGRPRYVLLVGDGSYDPKNNLRLADAVDILPVHLDAGPYEYCSMDGWFAAVHGEDYLPDVALGRLPARTVEECRVMVDKIIAYEKQAQYVNRRALLAADKPDTLDYAAASETWVAGPLLSAGFSLDRVYLGQTGDPRRRIVDGINAGCGVVNYFGHGAGTFWSAEDMFNTQLAESLVNSVWPVFTMLTCANGDADDPLRACLAEVLLRGKGRGAVACVAASALPVQYYSELFADGFYRAFAASGRYERLGDVVLYALQELHAGSPGARELMTYNLLGDPALRVK